MKTYYEMLINEIPAHLSVKSIVRGVSWIGAELSDGSFGIAMNTAGESRPRMFPELCGLPAKCAAEAVMSWNLAEAGEGMAVINAYFNSQERLHELSCYSPYDRVCTRGMQLDGKSVAFIGHLRMPAEATAGAKEVYIIEREPKPGDYPDSACEYLLPRCELVIISGSAAINKTLPRLLELSENADVILTGPSVPMCPELKALGISRLSGMVVRDKAELISWMTKESGSPYRFGDTFLI